MVNARTAKASDYDRAAQNHANTFWFWLVVVGVVWYFASWQWALVPAAMGVFSIIRSVGSTRAAHQLRQGTYRIPNPNNGIDS